MIGMALLMLSLAQAAVAGEAPARPDRTEQLRRQLAAYFANLHDSSPTVLGSQPQDQKAREALQRRIATMSREELEELAKGFSQIPNWQIAPEALAASLPPATRDQLNAAGLHFASKAGEASALRDEVASVAAFTGMLPPATLKELGLNPADIAAVQQGFSAMSPLQVAMLQERLPAAQGLHAKSTAVLASLPQNLREGVGALAEHGQLTAEEKASLQHFGQQVGTLLAEIRKLPPEARKRFDAAKIEGLAQRISSASPEVLFVIREQVGEKEVARALAAVRLLGRISAMTETERLELEAFRSELRGVLSAAGVPPGEGMPLDLFDKRLAGMAPEQLLVLREALDTTPAWREAYPMVVAAMARPEVVAQTKAVGGATPDAAAVAALESFRQQTLTFLEQRATGESAKDLAPAIEALRRARPPQLALIRAVYERLPQEVAPATMAAVIPISKAAVDIDCRVSLGTIDLDFLGEIDLGSIDFNFLCNPLEDAINAVASSIDSVVNAIGSVVNDVWSFLQGLPDVLLKGIQDLFETLLDLRIGGFSLRDLTNPANLERALGLGGSFWQNLPQVPQIPCPPEGTQIPLFGEVGDAETAAKYSRYKWLFDKLLGMIPDTEMSLPLKIPAQILYGGVEYLEICLQAAAEERDAQETSTFRTNVNTSLATSLTNDTSILSSISSLSGQVTNQGNTLVTLIQTQGNSLSHLIQNEANELTQQIDTFQQLDLRLEIEANLFATEGNEISRFQLPEPWGYLDLVRDIVRDTIDNFLAAGLAVNSSAEKELAAGDADRTVGNYRNAYSHFQKAYRAAVKKGPAGK
jgi:hypothetical protein